MKNIGNMFGKAILICLFFLTALQELSAQINIQVRVVPPYQSRINEYLSRPELMLLTVVNTSTTTQNIQLTASITGNNGISAWVKPGYRSPNPMQIAPGQALNLNALDISHFFDPQSVEYTGISRSDINRGIGLTEGTYQLCIQALDYETLEALSPSEPMGCTFFTISSVEPPRILMPNNGQTLNNTGPQAVFPISWSTPPGSSPLTEYRVRIVEMIAKRDPNDAMQTAIGPVFFDETVNTNTLLYGPAHPQLTPGREYALMVQAIDPYQTLSFRNDGKSEVISFIYGEDTNVVVADAASPERTVQDTEWSEGATNAVSGRLMWAFKMDEDQYQYRRTTTAPMQAMEMPAMASHTLANHYVGYSPLHVMGSSAMSQQDPTMNPMQAVLATPTLQDAYPGMVGVIPTAAKDLISAFTATSVSYSIESTRAEPSSRTKPLQGATVLIRGVHATGGNVASPSGGGTDVLSHTITNESGRSLPTSRINTTQSLPRTVAIPVIGGKERTSISQDIVNTAIRTPLTLQNFTLAGSQGRNLDASSNTQQPPTATPPADPIADSSPTMTLLASGESNADGYFSLNFLHPEYEGRNPYSKLIVSVQVDGFEPFEKELPIDALNQPEALQLGELVMMAKSYRMLVNVSGPDGETDQMRQHNTKVTWLRKTSEVAQNPHLLHEGNIASDNKKEIVLDGVRYTTISEQEIRADRNASGQFTAGTGRLFYQGGITVHIENGSSSYQDHHTTIRVQEPQINADQTMQATAAFELDPTNPGLGGEVMLRAGSQLTPVPHAVIHVEYDQGDVLHGPIDPYFAGLADRWIQQPVTQMLGDLNIPMPGTLPIADVVNPWILNGTDVSWALAPHSVSTADLPGIPRGSQSAAPNTTGRIVTTTDSSGRYYLNDLPTLRDGASFTVRLAVVPKTYQKLPVDPEIRSYEFQGKPGSNTVKDFFIIAEAFAVTGKVVNEKDQAVPFARVNFKGSSAFFETDESGQFATTYHKGTHTIQVDKDGYLPFETEVEIGSEASAWESLGGFAPPNSIVGLDSVPPFLGPIPPPLLPGMLQDLPQQTQINTRTANLGTIGPLQRRLGKVQFVVRDKETGTPLPGVEVQLFDTTHVTNDQGICLYEGYGGTTTVTFRPADQTPYYAIEKSISIEEDGATTQAEIEMEKGIRVSGKISSGPNALADAKVSLEGNSLHQATSDAQGQYAFYLPAGEQNLRAAKSGYFSKTENRVLDSGQDLVLDFNLDSGDGKNISQLLGFDIELDKAVPDSTGTFERWSGKFVNLQPGTEFFAGNKTYELPFANVKVTFDAAGNAIPENHTVETDAKTLKLKIFEYLPVILIDHESKNNHIKVTQNELGIGSIRGGLLFDFREITGRRRFKFNEADSLFVGLQSHVALDGHGIEFFRSEKGSIATEVAFRLLKAQEDTTTLELFGFELSVDLTQTRITNTGLEMAGMIKTPTMGIIKSASFDVKTLKINSSFDVTDLVVETNDLSKIGIDQLYAEVTGVKLNEDGFRLAGSIHTDIEWSLPSQIDFTELRMSAENLFGGQFVLPDAGIDIFKLAKFTTENIPLSFGRIGQTEIYSLAGSGLLEFKRLIKEEVKVNNFMVRSDGRFNVVVDRGYKASIGFADINIESIGLTYDDAPHLALNGKLGVSIPLVELEATNIRFYPRLDGQVRVETDTIVGRVNAPVVDIGVHLSLLENGLAGRGALNIPGTDIRAGVGFYFNKIDGGIDMGANFQVGTSIVLGAAEISDLGGGFTYSTSSRKFSGTIEGNVSVTGLSAAVTLKPAKLTVTDGPVIEGTADIVVADKFETAQAAVTLDFRQKYFAITVNAKMSPIEGVLESTIDGLMRVKWVQNDTYLFLGVNTQVKLASLLNANGKYVLAINIKNPRTRNDDLKAWFTDLDEHSYGNNRSVFSGILVQAYKEVGIPEERATGIDLIVVSGKAWFHAQADVLLIFNFAENDYLMQMKGGLSAGAKACIWKFCIGASFDACFNIAGGYNERRGWFLHGNAAGDFSTEVGWCNNLECNEKYWYCGVRICVGAHVAFNVSTRTRDTFSIHFGRNSSGNLCRN